MDPAGVGGIAKELFYYKEELQCKVFNYLLKYLWFFLQG